MPELQAWVDSQAAHIVQTAAACALGGDENWDALLAAWNVTPLPPEERRRHVTEGPQRPHGAAPLEVRWALVAVAGQAREAADRWEAGGLASDEESRLDRFRHSLDSTVEAKLRAYVSATRPKITTSSIFANAAATSRNMTAASAKAGVTTLQCSCCGAPRREGATSRQCEFCGSSF